MNTPYIDRVYTRTGYVQSLDDTDAQTMAMHERYRGHRTPAERINIIRPQPIKFFQSAHSQHYRYC